MCRSVFLARGFVGRHLGEAGDAVGLLLMGLGEMPDFCPEGTEQGEQFGLVPALQRIDLADGVFHLFDGVFEHGHLLVGIARHQ